ncbi:L-glutamate gamma-semialdehyde dehydrogenase [Aquimarina agarilytica]|uniref:L-glutamate gamma-semialdehyde dehydrogenase n=1 Tax=Aquimarina agarilytica TaxID=1087449 RepID=UPI0002881B0D|nr:L-glutamate gamma-semialdehyde dehydrogenase [Aquimarina agarilytica]
MSNAFYTIPEPSNELVKSYAKGSLERKLLFEAYDEMYKRRIVVPLYINGEAIFTENKEAIRPPHDFNHVVGDYVKASPSHVKSAIDSCLKAKADWEQMPWQDRAAIFLKAAALISGPYRYKINAATMIGQSKNVYQAEIDSACELIDFFNFNAKFLEEIYSSQPISSVGIWNRTEYRPLEGFVYAITPFNFTAIAGNLPAAPVLMGNVCVWKPSESQMYSANIIMEVLIEAGLPKGVINMVSGDPVMISDSVLNHKEFSGLHFTGSTKVFKTLWKQIALNLDHYKTYPKIVGETGGKDFVWAHPSADAAIVGTALIRGAFEYQGQKCSAASRAYIPKSMWAELKVFLEAELKTIRVGSPRKVSNFINAVIHEASFKKLVEIIEFVKASNDASILFGGGYDNNIGYFVDPTIIVAKNPNFRTMTEELFGPILSIYVYEDTQWEKVLKTVDQTSEYALTGAIFAQERSVITKATAILRNSAGNFYINDKPTGAVVGQQPFGGARGSGTNDKAGSIYNLLRWVSPRTIKENFVPPTNYSYPFLEE